MEAVAQPARAVAAVERSAATTRVASVDLLRGAVIVLMALDHVRDFFGAGLSRPEDLATTTPALFATRWVTHFCAPVFSLLAGTGAYLQIARGKPRGEVASFLLKRGVFLLLLDLLYMPQLWAPHFGRELVFATLAALGVGMIALAALIRLPMRWVAAVGVAIVAGHDLLDGVHRDALGPLGALWVVLHEQGPAFHSGPVTVLVLYPVLPWIGVMACGYALGPLLTKPQAQRTKRLLVLGAAMIALFVAIRALNGYGDPSPWALQRDAVTTALSFLRVSKYPPSLLYVLATLGPALIALALLERAAVSAQHPLLVFGRVPMFFYLVHATALPLLAAPLYRAQLGAWIKPSMESMPAGAGLSLAAVYLLWAMLVVALYWPCVAFGEYKRRHPEKAWLRYL